MTFTTCIHGEHVNYLRSPDGKIFPTKVNPQRDHHLFRIMREMVLSRVMQRRYDETANDEETKKIPTESRHKHRLQVKQREKKKKKGDQTI